jgi:hypothetical protein
MNFPEICLFLGMTPRSVVYLVNNASLPIDDPNLHYTRWTATQNDINEWRANFEPDFTIFYSLQHRFDELADGLGAQGHVVSMLECCINDTNQAPHVASRLCAICNRPTCPPHSLHYLRAPSNRLNPICVDCYNEHNPPCY